MYFIKKYYYFFSFQHIVGGTGPGHKDGSFGEAQFISPQGVCKVAGSIYIADCDTHHIRQVGSLNSMNY